MRTALSGACAALALGMAGLASLPLSAQNHDHAATVSPAIKAALADPKRPSADVDRDAVRHPGELLAFAGIQPGMKVADFMMGGGYFTRILADTVGPQGKVYGYQAAEFIGFRPAYAEEQKAVVASYPAITPLDMALAQVAFPETLDAIITVQNYHDLHLADFPADLASTVGKRLYDALKPGGVLLVVDHVAKTDPDFTVPAKLHRIDPAAARAEIEKAGFRFVGESKLLARPDDPHDKNVFDPSIRGKTDQFAYLFRKPG
ncbi:MAG TPA: methyltransferase [Sphingobium sp.]|nr:methyltransferase [Sphingobium sp.]